MTFSSILALARHVRASACALICSTFLLAGCAGLQGKSVAIVPGTTRAEVLKIMGYPKDRSFNGRRDEALQYCRTGFLVDEFLTIWLRDGEVDGLTTYTGTSGGLCGGGLRSIDWGQAPYDQRIKIDKNITIQEE